MSIKTPCDSLPPELLATIFNMLPLEGRKNGRLVSKYWRDVISSHSNVRFRIELNDNTVKWVKNLTFPKIENLWIHGLTTPLDSLNLNQKKIKTLRIGENNSTSNFWEVLSSCLQNEVEHLELESKPGKFNDFRHPLGLDFSSSTMFKSVKSFTLKVQKRQQRCCSYFEIEKKFSTEGWGLVLKVLRFPSIETLSFELDCANYALPSCLSFYVFELLNPNPGVKRLTLKMVGRQGGLPTHQPDPLKSPLKILQLEKLDLHFDFQLAPHVTPLIQMENQQLKQIRIKQTNFSAFSGITRDGLESLNELIHRNSASLEFLSIKAQFIDLAQLQLENCRSLRTLKLNTSSILIPEQMGRISHIKAMKIVGVGSLSNVLTGLGKRILEIFGRELEEFTLDFYNEFRIPDLERILRLPKIKKIVLVGIGKGVHPSMIRRYFKWIPGVTTEWMNRKSGTKCYHITIA